MSKAAYDAAPPTTGHSALARRQATYAAPYPSGWYRLCASEDIEPGAILSLECLGQSLIAFRGRDSGEVAVLDAHCPHQGANLAKGGKVIDDHIECPFHGWCFDRRGDLSSIPGLDRLPRASLRRHPVVERYGMVWTYHDVSGRTVEPPYGFPSLDEIDAGRLRHRGDHDAGEVRMHISEFAENSVDFQHFAFVHGDLTIPWTQIAIPGLGIHHDPAWYEDPDASHIAYFEDQACIKVRGKAYPKSGAHARITLFGPGGLVWFRFTLPELGQIVLFQTHLPIEPLRQRVHFRWYADAKIPRPLVWWVVGHWLSQWKADIAIWENKIYKQRPVLVSLDGPVHRMRRWYRQFNATVAPDAESPRRVAATTLLDTITGE